MPPIIRRLIKNQQAATLIEYSLIVALIATASVGAMKAVGTGIQTVFDTINGAMN